MGKKFWVMLIILLLTALAGEFYMHPHYKFEIASIPFFKAIFGFIACVAITIISKIIGILLKRKTDYYKEVRDD
jgi:hypothetical protein